MALLRDKKHFHLRNLGANSEFKSPRRGFSSQERIDVNRIQHAEHLLKQLSFLQFNDNAGLYLKIEGREGETLATESLNKGGLDLLSYHNAKNTANETEKAVVFASDEALGKLSEKIRQFGTENSQKGKPKNQNLVQPIDTIAQAELRDLWRGTQEKFATCCQSRS